MSAEQKSDGTMLFMSAGLWGQQLHPLPLVGFSSTGAWE